MRRGLLLIGLLLATANAYAEPILVGVEQQLPDASSAVSGWVLTVNSNGQFQWEPDDSGTGGGGSGDITAVGDVASGAAFDGTQGTTLTFNGTSDGTLSWDGNDLNLNAAYETMSESIFEPGMITLKRENTAIIDMYSDGGAEADILFNGSNGTLTTPTASTDNNPIGLLQFAGHDGDEYIPMAGIEADIDGAVANNSVPGKISLWTGNGGVGTIDIKRMEIRANGDVEFNDGTDADIAFNFHLSGATDPSVVWSNGQMALTGDLALSNGSTSSGLLKILEDTDAGTNFATLQVPALAANTQYTLPTSLNLVSGYVLKYTTDGTGQMTWEADKQGSSNVPDDVENVSFGITIDGGGSAITTGLKGYLRIPYDMTITGWDLVSLGSGSIVIDIWKDSYANFPPLVTDTIAGSEKPTLSTAIKNQDNTLSTWTTSVVENDYIAFSVDSVTTVSGVFLSIKGTKS